MTEMRGYSQKYLKEKFDSMKHDMGLLIGSGSGYVSDPGSLPWDFGAIKAGLLGSWAAIARELGIGGGEEA